MVSVVPNIQVFKKALRGPRAVYSIKKHPNLYLAADGSGGGAWRIKYRAGQGRNAPTRWMTISSDARNANFEEVVKKAGDLLNGLRVHGVDPKSTRPSSAFTFGHLFNGWLETYAKTNKKSWQTDEALYERHIQSRLATELTSSIDRMRVIAVLDDIAKKVTPIQANRCQSVISAVFSWALDEGKVASHPALRIRRRGVETARELVMSDDQLRAFWTALDAEFEKPANIIRLLLLTGTRLSEVAEATTSELHLGENALWTIPGKRTKNGITHSIPLTSMSKKLFADAIATADQSPFVFPARRLDPLPFDGNHASRIAKKIFRAINVPNMRLHDLRHQAATGMAQCGVPLDIRQMVQNQITGRRQSMGAVYDQHDYTHEKQRALKLWEDRLTAVITASAPPKERY